jgi:hypothetical protein
MAENKALRIGNCSGFYGDRLSAAKEMVFGGDIDVLTGDYLAELTMFILWKSQAAGKPGYATSFLKQMDEVLVSCVERGIKIVVNAGGLDPEGLSRALADVGTKLGVAPKIAFITGDNLIGKIDTLREQGLELKNLDTGAVIGEARTAPVTANAYLGARGIAKALGEGADIVICPRVTDASLVVGPAMWHHNWDETDYDRIAGAVAAGHVIECGAQATGGNYAFFDEIEEPLHPGFPIAEVHADGSSVITKHEGTGGEVSVGTVTAQLVYEVQGRSYYNTDVTLDLGSIKLEQLGRDRVLISEVRGSAPPETAKMAVTFNGTFNQSVTFAIPGEEVEKKAELAKAGILDALGGDDQFEQVQFRLVRSDQAGAQLNELSVAKLVATFSSYDKSKLGRRIFDAAFSLALSTYPGVYFPDVKQKPTQSGVNWPCLVPQSVLCEKVTFLDGTSFELPAHARTAKAMELGATSTPAGTGDFDPDLVEASIGTLYGARSGDKGANANIGLWARSEEAYRWLESYLTEAKLLEIFPEAKDCGITRIALPNILALNFVIHGILGDGAASGARFDPQAKGLAEFIRSRVIEVPSSILSQLEKVAA